MEKALRERREPVQVPRRVSYPLVIHEEEKTQDFATPDSSPFWDVMLCLDSNECLYASKAVLGLWSNVFFDLLQMEFEENVLPLPGKTKEQIVALLTVIYPPAPRDIDLDSLPLMLSLSDEYDMPVLKQKCEEKMLQCIKINTLDVTEALELADAYKCGPAVFALCDQILSNRPTLHTALLADKYNLVNLQENCIEALSDEYHQIKEDKRLASLSPCLLQRIMSRAFEKLQARMIRMQSVFKENEDEERQSTAGGSYVSYRVTQDVCRSPSRSPTSSSDESNLLFPYRSIRRTTSSYV